MEDLDFYKLLTCVLSKNDDTSKKLYLEVCERLKQLQHKEQVTKWDNLCYLIENTTEDYEREYKDYVNVTINYNDNVITITNHI